VTPGKVVVGKGVREVIFRVSVKKGTNPGVYKVRWDTQGDRNPPTYSPLPYLDVEVIDTEVITANVSPLTELAAGATSIPVYITLPNAPDQELVIAP
jgi:hypothetical protein